MNWQTKKKYNFFFLSIISVFIITQIFFWIIFVNTSKAVSDAPTIEKTSAQEMMQKEIHKAAEEAKETAKETKNEIVRKVEEALMRTAAITLKNSLIYLAQEGGRQVMQYVATGNWGDQAMFWDKTLTFMKDEAIGAATQELLDPLAESWASSGFDICDPSIEIKMGIMKNLQLTMPHPQYEKVQPRCDWNMVRNNWVNFYNDVRANVKAKVGMTYAAMGAMQKSLDIRQNEFGIFLTLLDTNQTTQREKYELERDERMAPAKLKSKTDLVTHTVQSPDFMIQAIMRNNLETAQKSRETELKSAGDIITEIPEQVLFAFVQSFGPQNFINAMMQRIMKGMVKRTESFNPVQQVYETDKAINEVTSEVLTADFSFEPRDVSLIDEFVNCPTEGSAGNIPRGINDCVMNRNFAEAIRRSSSAGQAMTVRNAINEGLLDPNKPFISPSDPMNTDPTCYKQGYCYTNLKKLRKARVIPIGWEIAAQKTGQYGNKTLADIINAFDDENSPFYRLIDPDWVLKEPINRCIASGYGPDLVGSGAEDRSEVCAGYTSCIEERPNGECIGGYGYCAEEERTWRLNGDPCEPQYAGCVQFFDRDGESQSWILDTLDPSGCDAGSVGCRQYSLWQDPPGTWSDSVSEQRISLGYNRWIFLNQNIEDQLCPPDAEGCARFIRTAADLGTNLLVNAGFEDVPEEADFTEPVDVFGWRMNLAGGNYESDIVLSEEVANSGNHSAYLDLADNPGAKSWELQSESIPIVPKDFSRYYTLSFFVNVLEQGEFDCDIYYYDPDSDSLKSATIEPIISSIDNPSKIEPGIWQRHYAVGEVPLGEDNTPVSEIRIGCEVFGNTKIYLDDFQLEEVLDPTSLAVQNPYGATNAEYLKKAPAYLNCYDGNEENDSIRCDEFAQLCSAEEVGCETFRPTAGVLANNAVVGRYNYCPAECNGYQTYAQSATFFEPRQFPLFFIPTTAQNCDIENVGCESYTNLTEAEAGGEAVYYFKKIRQCALADDPDCAPFYTWTGSDASGYQVQSHSLIDADNNGEPDITNEDLDAESCSQDIYQEQIDPDCRQFYGTDENGDTVISYHSISLTITCSDQCEPYRLEVEPTERDINTGAAEEKCEESNGRWDEAISRCVYDIIADQAEVCPESQVGCREYFGNFSGNVQVIYNEKYEDSLSGWSGNIEYSSEALNLGGHSLKISGNGSAVYTVADDDTLDLVPFNQGQQYQVSVWVRPAFPEDYDYEGESLFATRIGFAGAASNAQSFSLKTADWAVYSFEFTKDAGDEPMNQLVFDNDSPYPMYIDNISISRVNQMQYLIKNSWVTPESCDQRLDSEESLPQAMLGCQEYRDRDDNLHYLRSFNNFCDQVGCEALVDTKNSITPQSREFNPGVIDLCGVSEIKSIASLGGNCDDKLISFVCNSQTIMDTNYFTPEECMEKGAENISEFLTGLDLILSIFGVTEFEGLVSLEKMSCNLLNEEHDYAYSWDAEQQQCVKEDAIDSYFVPKDDYIYLVNSEEVSCEAEQKGCTAMAQADFDSQGNITDNWFATHLIIDPDNLQSKLCSETSMGCEQYADTDNNIYFVKDPGDRYCELRDCDTGKCWFEVGTDNECTQWQPYQDGNKFAVPHYHHDYVSPGEETGWAAVCPEGENACTAFVDPAAKGGDNFVGKTYYFKNNEKIDRDSCNGMVDPGNGCLLFNDTSLSEGVQYNADFSYFENQIQNEPVPPINLEEIDTDNISENILPKLTSLSIGQDMAWVYGSSESVDLLPEAYSDYINDYSLLLSGNSGNVPQVYRMYSTKFDYRFVNDSNVVLKVSQDRQCAKWYSCLSPSMVWDERTGTFVRVCEAIGLCDEYSPSKGVAYCSHVIPKGQENYSPLTENDYFTAEDYQERNSKRFPFLDKYFDLYTPEYSGYSIVDHYPLHYIEAVNLKEAHNLENNYYTVAANPQLSIAECDAEGAIVIDGQCYQPKYNYENLNPDSAPIGLPDEEECRLYPKVDTPFPVSAVFETIGNPEEKISEQINPKYENAEYFGYNLLSLTNREKKKDYGCNYKDVSYGRGQVTLHLPVDETAPPGVCDNTMEPCECTDPRNPDNPICTINDCKGLQNCLQQDLSITNYFGWEGYCLEEDDSRTLYNDDANHPCMTWFPVDRTVGLLDQYNQYIKAGFSSNELPYYCLTAQSYLQEKAYFNENVDLFWKGHKCHMQTGADSLYGVWLYEKIREAVNDFELETPEERIYQIAKDFDEMISNNDEYEFTNINYKEETIDIKKDIREEYMNMIVNYYISNKGKNNNGNCGEGYFPVFAPCAKDKSFETLPGYGYGKTGDKKGHVLCVPFNSVIDIPEEEIAKWHTLKPLGVNIEVFQGMECRPHFTRGEQLMKNKVTQNRYDATGKVTSTVNCLDNTNVCDGGACDGGKEDSDYGININADGTRVCLGTEDYQLYLNVGTVYDYVVAMDNDFFAAYWPDTLGQPPESNVESISYSTNAAAPFWPKRSDVAGGYFWEVRPFVEMYNKEGYEEYIQGIREKGGDPTSLYDTNWRAATAERGRQSVNFDFLLPLYRYCVQKTPITDSYKTQADKASVEGDFIPENDDVEIGIVEYVENWLKVRDAGDDNSLFVSTSAMEDIYLGEGQVFSEGKMLCDNLAEVEDENLDDKAWTNRLYGYYNNYYLSDDFEPWPNDLTFYYSIPPEPYGKVEKTRFSEFQNTDEFVPAASCSYQGGSGWKVTPLKYRKVLPPSSPPPSEIAEAEKKLYCEEIDGKRGLEQFIEGPKSYTHFNITGESYNETNTELYPKAYMSLGNASKTYEDQYFQNILDHNLTLDIRDVEPFNRLSQLFAKVYDVWRWKSVWADEDFYRDPNDGAISEEYFKEVKWYRSHEYFSDDVQMDNSYFIVANNPTYQNNVPVVAGIEQRPDGSYLAIPNTVTLKTFSDVYQSGQIYGREGQLILTMRFFGWADDDHMPVKRVQVNWGDGTPVAGGTQGQYKNYKPMCASDPAEELGECDNPNIHEQPCYDDDDCYGNSSCVLETFMDYGKRVSFGNIPDACAKRYYQKTHTYVCMGPEGMPECPGGASNADLLNPYLQTGCWDPNFEGGACVYRPGAQILDNWGWCNGSCDETPGCYNDGVSDSDVYFGRCDNRPDAYTRFNGVVIVTP